MTIELASRTIVNKPWGQVDPSPWTAPNGDGAPIGEIWFGRQGTPPHLPSLLLKLLFTAESLSVRFIRTTPRHSRRESRTASPKPGT